MVWSISHVGRDYYKPTVIRASNAVAVTLPKLPNLSHSLIIKQSKKTALSLIQTNIIFEILFADGSAGEMVNPAKTAAQVNTESMEGKDLYKFSHSDYEVGKSKLIIL